MRYNLLKWNKYRFQSLCSGVVMPYLEETSYLLWMTLQGIPATVTEFWMSSALWPRLEPEIVTTVPPSTGPDTGSSWNTIWHQVWNVYPAAFFTYCIKHIMPQIMWHEDGHLVERSLVNVIHLNGFTDGCSYKIGKNLRNLPHLLTLLFIAEASNYFAD